MILKLKNIPKPAGFSSASLSVNNSNSNSTLPLTFLTINKNK